jgi:hypothetical protein
MKLESVAVASPVRPSSLVVRVPGFRLPAGARLREPTRPLEARQQDFNERFDFDTLFYDALWNVEQTRVRLVAPALLNLSPLLAASTISAQHSGVACHFEARNLDRASEVEVAVPPGTTAIVVTGPVGTFYITPTPTRFELFEGRRVVFTLSKNNHLPWIKDWARYYRDVHGAEAVLIYDNMSTAYSSAALAAALQEVEGITAVVVEWPFRHGAPGFGLRRYWDSNFSQLGVLAHARWNFLQRARSVLNCDIDELVVSRRDESVFAQAERSPLGVVSFMGDWMFGIEGITKPAREDCLPKFTDYQFKVKSRWGMRFGFLPSRVERCKSKWAAVPARTPLRAQWHIHTVNGWPASRIHSHDLSFRHFREINFNWKYDRLQREPFDPSRHVPDPELNRSFARVRWDR